MQKLSLATVVALILVFGIPSGAAAQQSAPSSNAPVAAQQKGNVPGAVKQAEEAVEDVVRRFGLGVQAGIGLDPELIMFGGHATFAPIFNPNVEFRPVLEFGVGEITTMVALHFDFLYTLPDRAGRTWTPYLGAGPNLAVSHRGFESEGEDEVDDRNRFDFSDTDVDGGFNVIAGVRRDNGVFVELKASAYGVSNIRMLLGFTF